MNNTLTQRFAVNASEGAAIKKIHILVVDDHPAMRHGLTALISQEPDLEICCEAGNREETLQALSDHKVDFIILDISLQKNERSGLSLIPEIHAYQKKVPILVYSMHDELVYAERALQSGAHGYLMKQEPVRQITKAIHHILNEGIYVSDTIHQRLLLEHLDKDKAPSMKNSPNTCLTNREFEVFSLLGKGLQPRELAQELNLSVKTVETHRLNIRRKLDLENAAELIHYAIEWIHRIK